MNSPTEWHEYISQVDAAALGQIETLLRDWFPAGRRVGREYECGDLSGAPGKSLKINLDTGVWADFATGAAGGDLVSLYATKFGLKQGEAALRMGRSVGMEAPKLQPVASNNTWTPVVPAPAPPSKLPWYPRDWGTVGGAWSYLDAQGHILCYRVRFNLPGGGKDIRPLTWCRNAATIEMAWRWRDLPAPRPLYGLQELAQHPDLPVLLVEGEKTAEAAGRLLAGRWVAMTWGAASRTSRQQVDWAPLLARKTPIRVWPDADNEGKKAAVNVAAVFPASADLQLVVLDPVWAQGWDLADAEAEGWDGARVEAWIAEHSVAAGAAADVAPNRLVVHLATADHGELQMAIWEAVGKLNAKKPRYFWAKGSSRGELRIVEQTPFDENVMIIVDDPALARAYLTHDLNFTTASQWGERPTTPKAELMMSIVKRPERRLPILRRLVSTPIFVAGGRLISRRGYDAESQVFYAPSAWARGIEVPDHPTEANRDAAKATIEDVLHDFQFVTEADHANAYALMMLPLVREMIAGPTPLHRLEAPEHGSGKSLLASVLTAPITREPFLLPETEDEEEWRKVLLSALRNGEEVINIDNCRHLNSGVLASLLTAYPAWGGRPLGQNDIVHYEISCIFISTVNNPEWSREMHRRMARIRIDPGVENPYERTDFRHKQLIAYVRQQRPALLQALLTLVRYGLEHATTPTRSKGSYEAWAHLLGGILGGIGMDGFLASIEEDRSVRQDGLSELVEVWFREYGSREVRSSDLISVADSIESLELGGRDIAGRQKSLGKFLKQARDRIVGGKKIKTRILDGYNQFWLEEMVEF